MPVDEQEQVDKEHQQVNHTPEEHHEQEKQRLQDKEDKIVDVNGEHKDEQEEGSPSHSMISENWPIVSVKWNYHEMGDIMFILFQFPIHVFLQLCVSIY